MKKIISLFLAVLMLGVMLAGCAEPETEMETGADYGEYPFVNVSWTRDAEHDEETIRFGVDGSFTYYCACGNPVNDSDACEGYVYDDETKTITLNCFETIEGMITVIKIVKCEENELHLDFGGELRVFTK
jgi:hypothetical protein